MLLLKSRISCHARESGHPSQLILDSRLRGNDNSRTGFMLLEVILSVLIIASGLVLVIRSYTTSLRASQVARRLSKACLLLEDKIFALDVKGFTDGISQEPEGQGIIEGESGYTWYLNSESVESEEKVLARVDLDIAYKIGGRIRKVGISTYLKYKEG